MKSVKNNFEKIIPKFEKFKKLTKIYLLATFLIFLSFSGIEAFLWIKHNEVFVPQVFLFLSLCSLVIIMADLIFILLKTSFFKKRGEDISSFRIISTLFISKETYYEIFKDITNNFEKDLSSDEQKKQMKPSPILFLLTARSFFDEDEDTKASHHFWYDLLYWTVFVSLIWFLFCTITFLFILLFKLLFHWKLSNNGKKILTILKGN
ncbi:hypothetical protein [Williamsoniiplasma lucivorax]|nr:hypothetical protein [Williamsoniiplasma lucivorax]